VKKQPTEVFINQTHDASCRSNANFLVLNANFPESFFDLLQLCQSSPLLCFIRQKVNAALR